MRVQVLALFRAIISSSIAACKPGWAKAWKRVVGMVIESRDAQKGQDLGDRWLKETKEEI